jgi:septal ring factor EnvC (AmiA/AmiB activator)
MLLKKNKTRGRPKNVINTEEGYSNVVKIDKTTNLSSFVTTNNVNIQKDYEDNLNNYSNKMKARIEELDRFKDELQEDLKKLKSSRLSVNAQVSQTENLLSAFKLIIEAEKELGKINSEKAKNILTINKTIKIQLYMIYIVFIFYIIVFCKTKCF